MSQTATAIAPEAGNNGKYGSDDIRVLRDAAHIRQNPGMYIGDTSVVGLHHLVYELVHNSIDEALAGFCKHIHVTVNVDGSVTVTDDGRGIPVDLHPKENRPTLEVVLTTAGAGAKFDNNVYKVSAGLHGMGAKAVTALSEWTEAEVRRGGKTYHQKYERGYAVTKVKEIGAADHTGTKITFKPDPEIFSTVEFSFDTLEDHLRELAFLNRGIAVLVADARTGKSAAFEYTGGLAEFVTYLNRDEEAEHPPVSVVKELEDMKIEAAFQYTRGEEERVRCYANNAHNPSGGTHLSGFRTALTRTLNTFGEKEGVFKGDAKPIGEDFRKGLTAVVSVQLADPKFESQKKVKLNNPEVDPAVASAVSEQLQKFLEENPPEAKRILAKVLLEAKAREAAKKARDAEKSRKGLLSGGGLPGKLMDCTSKSRDDSELFLVEGDSAGGSAEQGRDRNVQAVLPLRGKPLNVERARLENLLKNDEIVSIISASGIDIGNTEDISKLRYGKIVILTDADVDGQHIRTLLLTFFFRQMRKVIEEGHIFVARPPLYKVKKKSQDARFIQTADEMDFELVERGLSNTRLTVLAAAGRTAETVLEGERLARLVQADPRRPAGERSALMADVEKPLIILERRGLGLSTLLPKATAQGLPSFWVKLGRHEHFFHDAAEVDAFRLDEQKRLGKEIVVADTSLAPGQDGAAVATGGHAMTVVELHEVRSLNAALAKLAASGLAAADLIPLPRVAGREPPERFVLTSGETRKSLTQLRDLMGEVRRLGERGLAITRFKGLGEMNAEELWDTTLDPEKRTLLRVTMEDAVKADEWFRKLMGETVEDRRKFIFEHGINVTDIDYHGA